MLLFSSPDTDAIPNIGMLSQCLSQMEHCLLNNMMTIELPKLKTKEERKEHLCGRNRDAPLDKQKHLIRLLNQERKSLGYESFYQ